MNAQGQYLPEFQQSNVLGFLVRGRVWLGAVVPLWEFVGVGEILERDKLTMRLVFHSQN